MQKPIELSVSADAPIADSIGDNTRARTLSGAEHSGKRIHTLIRPSSAWRPIHLAELWQHRELLGILAWRDIKVRYKQTLLGAVWAILQPLLTMLVFYALFRLLGARPTSGGVPYAVSTFAALIVWQLFATSMASASDSLIVNQGLIKKVYFPRLIIPLAPVLAGLVDFAVAFALLVAMMVALGVEVSWTILTLPAFVLLAVLTALAVGMWLSGLSAMYRDFRYTIPFLAQIWLFVTPVVYETASVVPEEWRPLYFLNPMAGVVEGFRWALFGTTGLYGSSLAVSVAAVAVLLLGGLYFFKSLERTLADWV